MLFLLLQCRKLFQSPVCVEWLSETTQSIEHIFSEILQGTNR